MKQGTFSDISNHDYHHHPNHEALSASGIKALLRSPAHYRVAMKMASPTPAMIFGTAAHSFILQPEKGEVICEPEDINKHSKEGRAQYEAFLDANKERIIVDQKTHNTLTDMRKILLSQATARMLLERDILNSRSSGITTNTAFLASVALIFWSPI